MAPRLIAIEEKIAHLERHLGELDGVVRDMNDRFDGFKREIKKMQADLEAQQAGSNGGDAADGDQQMEDDKPPHW